MSPAFLPSGGRWDCRWGTPVGPDADLPELPSGRRSSRVWSDMHLPYDTGQGTRDSPLFFNRHSVGSRVPRRLAMAIWTEANDLAVLIYCLPVMETCIDHRSPRMEWGCCSYLHLLHDEIGWPAVLSSFLAVGRPDLTADSLLLELGRSPGSSASSRRRKRHAQAYRPLS